MEHDTEKYVSSL
jgi:hypothetical protein